jgi:thioredoxin reductase (NADPH)
MHDVIIIGGGPAGLTAAFWCDDLGLDTLLIERSNEVGGQLKQIHNPIDNYPGLRAPNGADFLERFSAHVSEGDFDQWTQAEIESVDLKAKRIVLRSGEQLQAIALVIATGVSRRKLGIPGETELIGKGIIESGVRDRDLFANKDVCVIGGGDAAVENAALLAEVCPTVTLIHRGKKLRARVDLRERLVSNHSVTVFTESNVTRIIGDEKVEAVEVKRREGLKPFQIAVGGVLIRIGVEPNTELVQGQLELDNAGYVKVSSEGETSVTSVFAIGDVANPGAPTISGASGDGATVAKVIASRLTNPGRN